MKTFTLYNLSLDLEYEYVALYDFKGRNQRELSFEKGDHFSVQVVT